MLPTSTIKILFTVNVTLKIAFLKRHQRSKFLPAFHILGSLLRMRISFALSSNFSLEILDLDNVARPNYATLEKLKNLTRTSLTSWWGSQKIERVIPSIIMFPSLNRINSHAIGRDSWIDISLSNLENILQPIIWKNHQYQPQVFSVHFKFFVL